MPELIDLRRRIKSVRNTQQITQAMKTVATAKFKQAQRLVLEARPYWHEYPGLIDRMTGLPGGLRHPLMIVRPERRVTVLIISSDKGLAGAFNANVFEQAHRFIGKAAGSGRVNLVLMGKKAVHYFRGKPFPVERIYQGNVQKLAQAELTDLANRLIHDFLLNRCDAVYVAYNEFKSILAPQPLVRKLMPLTLGNESKADPPNLPDWEPDSFELLQHLLPAYIRDQIRHFYFESIAAEHAARMMSMDNATRNADDLIGELTMFLNKLRQRAITRELLEIMSAVDALAKSR